MKRMDGKRYTTRHIITTCSLFLPDKIVILGSLLRVNIFTTFEKRKVYQIAVSSMDLIYLSSF